MADATAETCKTGYSPETGEFKMRNFANVDILLYWSSSPYEDRKLLVPGVSLYVKIQNTFFLVIHCVMALAINVVAQFFSTQAATHRRKNEKKSSAVCV